MRHAPRALLAGGLGFAVSVLVACGGGSGLLSADQASTLNGTLDRLAAAVAAGQCGTASGAINQLTNAVANLPATVSTTLQANLNQGASTVAQLSIRDCQNAKTTTTPTTSTATTTQTTATQTTTTAPPTNTTTTPVPTTTTPATTPSTPGTTSTPTTGGAGIGNGNGQ
jgi:hypothetical protein